MKILIVGHRGFIGKSLTEYFAEKPNYEITGVSSKELNTLNESAVRDFLMDNKFDVIVNCAVFSRSRYPDIDCGKELELDLRMYFNFARYNYLYGKMIYLGSGAEFDKSVPICEAADENWNHNIPTDHYGFAKYIINQHIEKSDNIYNLRLFGIYGKYEDYRRKFITGACAKAVCDLPLTIRQNVYFDYLYIDDFCVMFERFLEIEKPLYHSYNFSSGRKIDLITLANLVKYISKKNLPLIICKDGLDKEYTSDNSRLLAEIGIVKWTEFETSIEFLYNYYLMRKDEIDIMPLVYQ